MPRPGEILQQFGFVIEMDDKGQVAIFPENLVEEFDAGAPFVAQHPALAAAGVHQQAHVKRKAALPFEEFDGLAPALFVQLKVVFGQVFHDLSRFVPYRGEQVDELDVRGVFRRLLGRRALLCGEQARGGEQGKGGEQTSPGELIVGEHFDRKMHGRGFALPGKRNCAGGIPGLFPSPRGRQPRSALPGPATKGSPGACSAQALAQRQVLCTHSGLPILVGVPSGAGLSAGPCRAQYSSTVRKNRRKEGAPRKIAHPSICAELSPGGKVSDIGL